MTRRINYHEGDYKPMRIEVPKVCKCHAIKDNGRRCRNDAMTGEVFCHSHLSVGYGLFTLAVVAQIDAVSIQRMENRDNG